jgi:hypothetical protein
MSIRELLQLVITLGLLASGCSASGSGSTPGTAGGAAGSGAQGGSAGSGTGGAGGSGGCPHSCSNDLKQIVDCNGAVVADCPSSQACAFGVCTSDPCEAAQKGGSSVGCDFWAVKTDVIFQGAGACFAAFVANAWSEPVHIKVERDGMELPTSAFKIPKGQGFGLTYDPYDPASGLPPGEVAILFLARGAPLVPTIPDCPVPAAIPAETGVMGTGRGKAFHITTDKPVVAYSILPYGGGASAMTSASLLLPTGVWGTNYLAINAYLKNTLNNGQPSLSILAHEEGTEVTISPKVDVLGGQGITGGPAGVPLKFQLARGEYVQLTQDAELSGSPIVSNKPVGFWGASSCMNIPVDREACDCAHQQIPPIKSLGHEYVGLRHRNRTAADEDEPFRIMGAVDGTTLTWIPAVPNGAPTTLGVGQVVEFRTSAPFVVKSQDPDHAFYLSTYMTGGEPYGGTGDPEWVNVVPTDQFLKDYVLFADPTYSDTSLVVTRRRGSDGAFADVTLDCAGVIGGWKPVGDYEVTSVDLVTGQFANVGNCSTGRRAMSSTGPFGVTVWGWGSIPGFPGTTNLYTQYVSYAYPAGAGVKPINDVDIPIPR